MDPKKANKIAEIVRLQQMLKKWKRLAVSPKKGGGGGGFLKRTFSFKETSAAAGGAVPKGFVAVCVGEELRRFVIPMECLSHRAFAGLLRDAEEEFGFQQEGVLRIPSSVAVFEEVLSVVEKKKKKDSLSYCSSEVGWLSPNSSALMSQYADD